ncbi:DUF2520 domain-containing protein [Parabacteroides sp. OttesenSCG-928-K15]|nr:DUF2520 domain-containing protein [Parabacteroides sp. OttesenSCG-928-K15]
MKIIFIGSGNLATRLSLEMHRAGMTIGQVYSRTEEHAAQLAGMLNAAWTSSIGEIQEDADLYVFSVRDAVLNDILKEMKPNKGLWVHTAGSLPMDIFRPYTERYGVFYPLQTFSKGREVAFGEIPFFLETIRKEDEPFLHNLASALSGNVQFLSSEKRKTVHLAAVFACNFTNHMYAIAARLLEAQGISFKALLPLIEETASKIEEMPPSQAQTGPAVRYDKNIIQAQADQLEDETWKEIYLLISQNIHKETNNESH